MILTWFSSDASPGFLSELQIQISSFARSPCSGVRGCEVALSGSGGWMVLTLSVTITPPKGRIVRWFSQGTLFHIPFFLSWCAVFPRPPPFHGAVLFTSFPCEYCQVHMDAGQFAIGSRWMHPPGVAHHASLSVGMRADPFYLPLFLCCFHTADGLES
eukprot:RCo011160